MRHTTKELYGVEPDHFDNMLYFDALVEKKKLAKQVMKDKTKESTNLHAFSKEYNKNYEIYTNARKSITYNNDLIEERLDLKK